MVPKFEAVTAVPVVPLQAGFDGEAVRQAAATLVVAVAVNPERTLGMLKSGRLKRLNNSARNSRCLPSPNLVRAVSLTSEMSKFVVERISSSTGIRGRSERARPVRFP